MFLGEFRRALEGGGRLALPSEFRGKLATGLFLTKGQDWCLYVFTTRGWNQEVQRIQALSRELRKNRNQARAFFAGATKRSLDPQGRILIPPPLRDYAALKKDVVVVGVNDRIEIWSAGRWTQISREADADYSGPDPGAAPRRKR